MAGDETARVNGARWLFRRIEANSWIISPAACIIVGATVNFKAAIILSCVLAVFFFTASFRHLRACGGRRYPADVQRDYPKLLDTMNIVIWAFLLPVSQIMGEDFCRLWVSVVITGAFMSASIISLAVGHPWLEDTIALGEDPRFHPMMKAVQRGCTAVLAIIFTVMFVSNLIVALLELQVGIYFIILNFVVPFGTLGVGMALMPMLGKRFWMREAQKVYGPNWIQVLFPDEPKDPPQGVGAQVDP